MIDIKKRLEDEIRTLEHELKIQLPKEIQKAREHGDLRENAEYKAAKERQSFLQARIGQLRTRLAALSMVNFDKIPRDKVGLGSTVTLRETATGEEVVYDLVTPEEADPTQGCISPSSPIGKSPPAPKGRRPRTDLRPVAKAVRWSETTSAFHQRLVYERLMAQYVRPEKRRDLKPPAYIHLDPTERFPRLSVRGPEAGPRSLYGPFRNRKAAARAVDALHKLFPLRPCDYTFEPAADLALGLGCVYAQVRTCAAPCLQRVG